MASTVHVYSLYSLHFFLIVFFRNTSVSQIQKFVAAFFLPLLPNCALRRLSKLCHYFRSDQNTAIRFAFNISILSVLFQVHDPRCMFARIHSIHSRVRWHDPFIGSENAEK